LVILSQIPLEKSACLRRVRGRGRWKEQPREERTALHGCCLRRHVFACDERHSRHPCIARVSRPFVRCVIHVRGKERVFHAVWGVHVIRDQLYQQGSTTGIGNSQRCGFKACYWINNGDGSSPRSSPPRPPSNPLLPYITLYAHLLCIHSTSHGRFTIRL